MLKNYFKTAIKVLKRNKLYTGISLFGISFTLMVLILASAVLENELGGNKPLGKQDRILFIPSVVAEGYAREKTTTYDSTLVDGVLKIDTVVTTKIIEGNVSSSSSSSLGYKLYKDKLSKLKTPEKISVFNDYVQMTVFPNNSKLALSGNMTDHIYWEIFDFDFIEGEPYTKEAVESQAREVVLKKSAAERYFGKQDSYLGKMVEYGLKGKFKVVGVVDDIGSTNRSVKNDFFIPISWALPTELDWGDNGVFGSCVVALLAKDASEVSQMQEELRVLEGTIEKTQNFDRHRLLEKDASDIYAWNFVGDQRSREGKKLLTLIFSVLGLFLVIPVFNLINLNVTRIFERSSEIGVRKAFGAKTKDLFLQFLFENLIITFIGGLIGLVLAYAGIQLLNNLEIFGNSKLNFNLYLLIISVLVTFVFGLLSGVIPAWKISKTEVAPALKSGKL